MKKETKWIITEVGINVFNFIVIFVCSVLIAVSGVFLVPLTYEYEILNGLMTADHVAELQSEGNIIFMVSFLILILIFIANSMRYYQERLTNKLDIE